MAGGVGMSACVVEGHDFVALGHWRMLGHGSYGVVLSWVR